MVYYELIFMKLHSSGLNVQLLQKTSEHDFWPDKITIAMSGE